jgi:hypothetical protein
MALDRSPRPLVVGHLDHSDRVARLMSPSIHASLDSVSAGALEFSAANHSPRPFASNGRSRQPPPEREVATGRVLWNPVMERIREVRRPADPSAPGASVTSLESTGRPASTGARVSR